MFTPDITSDNTRFHKQSFPYLSTQVPTLFLTSMSGIMSTQELTLSLTSMAGTMSTKAPEPQICDTPVPLVLPLESLSQNALPSR